MMWHSQMIVGLKRFLILSLATHLIPGKDLMRKLQKFRMQIFLEIIDEEFMLMIYLFFLKQFLSGSLVTHSFELESKVKTVYYGAPALITYRIPTKSRLQVYSLQRLDFHKQLHDIKYFIFLLISGSIFHPYSAREDSIRTNRGENNWNCNIIALIYNYDASNIWLPLISASYETDWFFSFPLLMQLSRRTKTSGKGSYFLLWLDLNNFCAALSQ